MFFIRRGSTTKTLMHFVFHLVYIRELSISTYIDLLHLFRGCIMHIGMGNPLLI